MPPKADDLGLISQEPTTLQTHRQTPFLSLLKISNLSLFITNHSFPSLSPPVPSPHLPYNPLHPFPCLHSEGARPPRWVNKAQHIELNRKSVSLSASDCKGNTVKPYIQEPHHLLSFMHKTHIWLKHSGQQEQRPVYLGTFLNPGSMDQVLDGFCSYFERCWDLHAGF